MHVWDESQNPTVRVQVTETGRGGIKKGIGNRVHMRRFLHEIRKVRNVWCGNKKQEKGRGRGQGGE